MDDRQREMQSEENARWDYIAELRAEHRDHCGEQADNAPCPDCTDAKRCDACQKAVHAMAKMEAEQLAKLETDNKNVPF